MIEKRPALGRGLSALIPDSPVSSPDRGLDVDTDLLRPNKFQPRTQMDDERIEDSAIHPHQRNHQPIVVRRADRGYEIVAGERRWRAAQRAGLLKVPVVVRRFPMTSCSRSLSSRTFSARISIRSKRPRRIGAFRMTSI